jgi:hypothetical protein
MWSFNMVPAVLLRAAVNQLEKVRPEIASKISWVNWRKGFQVKLSWFGSAAFNCYVDLGKNESARNALMKEVFLRFAPAGLAPKKNIGHGWTEMDYSLICGEYICLNDVVEMATRMGLEFTVLYVQSSGSARHLFDSMGIPLVPGEMGKRADWRSIRFLRMPDRDVPVSYLIDCKCGQPASTLAKKAKDRWLVRCSSLACPALVSGPLSKKP